MLQFRQADAVPTWQGYYGDDSKLARALTFSEYKKRKRQGDSHSLGDAIDG